MVENRDVYFGNLGLGSLIYILVRVEMVLFSVVNDVLGIMFRIVLFYFFVCMC